MKHGNFNEYKAMVDLTAIKDYCRENGRLCHYAKGETIVRQGAVGKYLGVIESGYYSLYLPCYFKISQPGSWNWHWSASLGRKSSKDNAC